MKPSLAALALLVPLAGCSTAPAGDIAPIAAVMRAAGAAPAGVPGTFALHVQATGHQDGDVFLNSERDYRDQRNLSIALSPIAQEQLRLRLGGDPEQVLRGRMIRVFGVARRVRIDFTDAGRPTGKYYYQTQVAVSRGDQVSVVD